MDVVRDDIKNLVKKELQAANEKFPQFRSLHEGAAVLLEEIEELRDEVHYINGYYSDLWEFVKSGYDEAGTIAESLYIHAVNAACEAVQVAAMAEKFLYALDHEGEAEERKCGHWTEKAACSQCGGAPWYSGSILKYGFCPYCGADMRKGG